MTPSKREIASIIAGRRWLADQYGGTAVVPFDVAERMAADILSAIEKPPAVTPGADRGGSSFYRGPMDVV